MFGQPFCPKDSNLVVFEAFDFSVIFRELKCKG